MLIYTHLKYKTAWLNLANTYMLLAVLTRWATKGNVMDLATKPWLFLFSFISNLLRVRHGVKVATNSAQKVLLSLGFLFCTYPEFISVTFSLLTSLKKIVSSYPETMSVGFFFLIAIIHWNLWVKNKPRNEQKRIVI